MSETPLICKNDQCRGKDFEQVSGNAWRCVYCGTETTLKTNKKFKKKIKPKKTKETPEINYRPITYICELCGSKIGTINHPREQKSFNELWERHECDDKSSLRYV